MKAVFRRQMFHRFASICWQQQQKDPKKSWNRHEILCKKKKKRKKQDTKAFIKRHTRHIYISIHISFLKDYNSLPLVKIIRIKSIRRHFFFDHRLHFSLSRLKFFCSISTTYSSKLNLILIKLIQKH